LVLRTYLVYNTVVRLCQFSCCGRKVNFVKKILQSKFSSRLFLLNPNFLLVHRNRYLEEIDDGQKTPRGHPDFSFLHDISTSFHIPDRLIVFAFCEEIFLISMLYPRKGVCGLLWYTLFYYTSLS
jgi:hypothetical protein